MKQSVARTLERLGLEPVILHEQPNRGQTLIEKIDRESDVGFAVVLLSPDDRGYSIADGEKSTRPRARQNVIVELGYFAGKLGRENVVALHRGSDLELPSDYDGVLYTPYDARGAWRTLSGAGRGTGPQHGQNLEGWLAHVPGLKVVWSSTPEDAKGLLKSAIRDDDPVVVVESLGLWGQRGEVPDEDRLVPIGLGAIRREGEDATVVAWGSTVRRALEAAEQLSEEGIEAEVLDLRTLSPIDEALILSSLRKTGRLVIVHDAVAPFGPGAEVATIAASAGFGSLKAPVTRVAPPFAPVPFTPNLEQAYFPQPEDVRAAVSNLVNAKA